MRLTRSIDPAIVGAILPFLARPPAPPRDDSWLSSKPESTAEGHHTREGDFMIARRNNPRPLCSQLMLLLFLAVAPLGWVPETAAQQAPAGEMVWAVHVTLPP